MTEIQIMSGLLDSIEFLLGVSEPILDDLSHEDRERWLRISASTADRREGVEP